MSRAELQQVATSRIREADVLLQAGLWSGAFYLAGYAVECGLKSCVLAHIERTGMIFKDKQFLKDLGNCWTHDLAQLLKLAGLKAQWDADVTLNPSLDVNWVTVLNWNEASRYANKTQTESQNLYVAITDAVNGVLPWIQRHW